MLRSSIFVLAFIACAFTLFVQNGRAQSDDCAKLESERKQAFYDLNKNYMPRLSAANQAIAQSHTTDPAEIDRQFGYAAAFVDAQRKKVAAASPSQKPYNEKLLKLSEQLLEFWRAKKASVETGVQIGGGDEWNSYLNQSHDKYQKQVDDAKENIDRIDREIEACKAKNASRPRGGGETVGGSWAGQWEAGNGRTYQMFSLQGKLLYNLSTPDGQTSGQGSCTINDNVAACTYEERFGSGSQSISMFGDQTLTRSNGRITEQRTLRNVQCTGSEQSWCEAAKKSVGKTVTEEWIRK